MKNIAKQIRVFLAKRHGELYASDKTAVLKGKSTAEVLQWAMVELDPQNQAALMNILGLPAGSAQVLRRAFDAAERCRATAEGRG